MSQRRRIALALSATLAAWTITAVVASAAPSSPLYKWKAPVGGVVRSSAISDGELVWTAGVWMAKGANADGLTRQDYYKATSPTEDQPTHIPRDLYRALTYDFFGAHRLTHNGDYQLPADPAKYPDGTGEVSEVRFASDGKSLFVRLLWNSMPSATTQIATLTFSSSKRTDLSRPWPASAELFGEYDHALTLTGVGATLDGRSVPSRIDVAAHTSEAAIPLSSLTPGPQVVRGGSGLAVPTNPRLFWNVPAGLATTTQPGTGALPTTTNVWELFFAGNTPWTFDELQQSQELSDGVATSGITVDPAALAKRVSSPNAPRTGTFSMMFRSSYFGGDGIERARNGLAPVGPDQLPDLPVQTTGFDENWYYTGRLQTYSMHVPANVTAKTPPRPLVVYLHGFTGTPEEPWTNPIGLVDAIDKKGWLLASAYGRGDGSYLGIHDLDVMEVIKDVSAHYNVDPNRIYLMGHSMGGYGTDNVSVRHPDLFAAVAPAEGTGSIELATNLRNVPWFVMTADEDIDPLAQDALKFYNALSAEGLDATALEYRLKIHEYSSIYDTIPRLMAFFSSHVRNPNPAVVTYARNGGDGYPQLGLNYDSAYWVSGLTSANPAVRSSINAETFALEHRTPVSQKATALRSSEMVDEAGPTGRTIAQLHQTIPGKGVLAPVARRIVIDASNLSAATIDLDRAGIPRTGISMRLVVKSSTGITITLTNKGTTRRLTLRAGTSDLKLTP